MQDMTSEMEFATETVEVEEISEDGIPTKKFKKVVKAYDSKFVTDWKNDPNYKNWVEKPKKEGETATVTTYHFETSEPTECIEIDQNGQRRTVEVVKNVRKPNIVTPTKNNRAVRRQIKVMDPNLPAFVCTEHNENITLECRYCRIASGFKKKNSQKYVQNDEISSSGKVTVAIPKRDANVIKPQGDVLFEGNSESLSNINAPEVAVSVSQKNLSQKHLQKFRSEWLALPEFKDWLVEFKTSEDADTSQAKCKYCGTLLVNNSNNLVRHAISKKHTKNMELELLEYEAVNEGQVQPMCVTKPIESGTKEEIFGRYVASELKRIKSKKTYEEVKWKILQALQTAAEKEADDPDGST